MGDRVSIQFDKEGDKSVVLFSHWDGMDFVKEAKEYVKKLKTYTGGKTTNPLDRMEPNTVMVDFIRHITKDKSRVEGNYYLAKSENEGDNSDNGHHIIKLG
jgi:hypothetical protein